jgi:CRISPR-associated protein Csh2
MSFKNRREFLFVYSVKDANPNGDPLNANQPRFDPESGQILVSDVRIKRTIRDQWLRDGLEVFVDGETKTLKNRVDEIKAKQKVNTGREAMEKCIDARLFGVTLALEKESFSWTGPVQFKWGRSLHKAKAELVQGTGAFTTKEEKDQRTFRNEYLVPFVLLGVYGIANQNSSAVTSASETDVEKIGEGLWQGTINLITRSKVGHQPRLFFEIKYKENFQGIIGSLDEKVCLEKGGQALSDEDQLALRNLKEVTLNIKAIVEKLNAINDQVESIKVWSEKGICIVGLDELKNTFGSRYSFEER